MKKYFLVIFIISMFELNAEVKLEDCASIKSDIKRLACYDYLTTGVSKTSEELSKKESNDTSSEDNETISKEEANFGLSNKQKIEAQIQVNKLQLNSKISNVSKVIGGKTRFKLSNDQLWESQSVLSSIKLNNFRVKNNIVIEEANMGGFWMINISSNVKIKVKRIS
ncbi:MAG: hypothetical protein EVA97_01060 [SAR86 cluster bacterium]|uniref:Uncharacterized protein n=1 Tax=SAR86 cluster bacterium TaxID=2030880 RepID=A0A520N6E2_9GAMM|nr:MAG: hypothetical protein EVA97_01060 [SAR86 cluster bacterium]